MRIGLCRALHTFHHFVLWKSFFEGLGYEVLLTPATTKVTVEDGIRLAPAELCLPAKVFLGCVLNLEGKADVVFLPRLVCWRIGRDYYFGCPKTLALPDLVRAIFSQLRKTLELVVDERVGSEEMSFIEMGRKLGVKRGRSREAFLQAKVAANNAAESKRRAGLTVHMFEDHHPLQEMSFGQGQPEIGLIGHPYLVFDDYISGGILKLIHNLGAKPIVPFTDKSEIIRCARDKNTPNWYYELELIAGVRQLLEKESVSGIILFSNFACGTASVVNELIRREIARKKSIPVLTLLVDEHTAEVGLHTRVESFVELLGTKR